MRLDAFAGGDPLMVFLDGLPVPMTAVGPISIRHGRPSAEGRPEASTCSLTFLLPGLAVWPGIGTRLDVLLSLDMLDALGADVDAQARFVGRVTDADVAPGAGAVSVVAAGPPARAARIPIGDTPWPAELDGARAARIFAELLAFDASFEVGALDPGTVTVLARDVDRQPVGALLDALAADTGGDAWQTREGVLIWRDALARQDALPTVVLDAGDVLASARATQSLDGLLTDLTVGYGLTVFDPVTGAESQATVRVTDPVAEQTYGYGALAATVSTQIASEADAEAYARDMVGRRSVARWRVPSLTVDLLRTLSLAQAAALLAAEPGALVEVEGLPTTWPLNTGRMWVEGWQEEISARRWRMTLHVTAFGLTGPALRWADVPADYQPPAAPGEPPPLPVPLTWDSPLLDGLSWLGATAWWPGEDVDLGRWADVPANLRWNTYPTDEWDDLP